MTGGVRGNVLLRKKQYEVSADAGTALGIARNCILGKVYNSRWVLERAVRDHSMQIDVDKVKQASDFLQRSLSNIEVCGDAAQLRGFEGEAASVYFGVFNQLFCSRKRISCFPAEIKGLLSIMLMQCFPLFIPCLRIWLRLHWKQ